MDHLLDYLDSIPETILKWLAFLEGLLQVAYLLPQVVVLGCQVHYSEL